jgi:diguanylate cyclase (GGDEF)-like protein/PAS domain S-box-containing protein
MAEWPAELTSLAQVLRTVHADLPHAFWIKSADSRYLASNTRYENMIGFSAEELLGKTAAEIFGPLTAARFEAGDRQCLQSGQAQVEEFWIQGGQGRARVEVTKTALKNAQGQILGVLGLAQDVTHRWQLMTLEQIQSQVLEAITHEVAMMEILAELVTSVENLFGGSVCAIGVGDGKELGHGGQITQWAAPNWDEGNTPALVTLAPAVCTREQAFTPWQDWVFGACLRAVDGAFLGVMTLHQEDPWLATEHDGVVLDKLARLAQLVLEKHRQRALLAASEQRYRVLAECTPEPILVHAQTRILYVNPAAVRLFGAHSAQQLLGTPTTVLVHPDYLRQQLSRMARIHSGEALGSATQSRFLRIDGSAFDVEVLGTAIVFGGQNAVHVSVRDITQRLATEQQLRLAANVFSHAREGIIFTDEQVRIVDVNEAFTRITGYSRDEVVGRNPSLLTSGQHPRSFFEGMWRDLRTQQSWSGELWNRRKTGHVYVQLQTITAVKNAQGHISHYMAVFSDITARKNQEVRLEHMAHYDALTGLPNRVLKADRLQQAMAQAQRRSQSLALAFIDLDGFKAINDNHGHEAGDYLLKALAQRMKQVMREGDTLARVGGDEFSAVIVDLSDPCDCEALLQRLLEAASQPVYMGDLCLQVSASVGVTFYPQAAEVEPEQLMRQADLAMYQAKQKGKNRRWVYGGLPVCG